jgi:glucose/mannose transport system permease protein
VEKSRLDRDFSRAALDQPRRDDDPLRRPGVAGHAREIFRNYYAAIPTELLEAAKVDGAGFFRIYRSILLPLSASGFVVVLIWQFNSVWNDFLFAATLTTPNNWPVTVALNNLAGSFSVDWNVQVAGALLAALPTLLIFVILGRFFVRGLLAGSLKG